MKKINIVLKKVKFGLTHDEEILFHEWLQKSEENRLLYKKLLLLEKEKKHINKFSELDVNEAWIMVQEKSNSKLPIRSRRVFNRKWMHYAVAASVALLISVTILYKNTTVFNSTSSTLSPTIVNNNIEIGTNKAVLTLDDGLQVALKKGASYKTTNASSNGEQLVYEASKKSHSEIKYNYLTVPRGGQFYVQLSDGTQVWLNSESQLKYPVAFTDGETRNVDLVYGEAYFEVSHSTEHKGSRFKVYSRGQNVEVLGTQFNVKAYNDETNIYTTLVEGKVAINCESGEKYLKPNQQSNLNLNDSSLTISNIDVKKEIAWKDGVFNFDSKMLKDIMVILSRWYDMDVVFENKALEKQKFVGLINKNYSIEDVLSLMKDMNIINSYSINNKTIVLK